jgi:hypothetical protein
MELERFQALLDDPRRTREELGNMRENALRRGATRHAHAAEVALDRLHPTWRTTDSRPGGSKATEVEFRGRQAHFKSQKAAYIWLVERFIEHNPKPFVELDWQTAFVAEGPRAVYFAKSLRALFGEQGQHLAADPNKWHHLSNGWYAKLVLSELQKIDLLSKLAAVARLLFGVHWDWNGQGRLNPQRPPEDVLREILAS